MDFCNFKQIKSDDIDWQRRKLGNIQILSGPDKDHTSGSGHFIYLGGQINRHGQLISEWHIMEDETKACVSFYYYMYGSNVDYLKVYVIDANNKHYKIWEKFGSQRKMWSGN